MSTPDTPSAQPRLDAYLSAIDALLRQIVQHGRFALSFEIWKAASPLADVEAPEYVVDFSGSDVDLLLERNAALLDALEYLVLKAVRLEEECFGRITFDCEEWRRLRAEELKLTAQVAAERVLATGEPFALSPMNPRERRIIHLALKDWPQVRTASEGFGPDRKVVILPASAPSHRSARH
jgi:spoIIIJ-associated protein